MAISYTDAFVSNAANLYRNGESVASIARRFGCDGDTLSKHLKRIGVNVTKVGRPNPTRIPMPDDFLPRYEAGESLLALAKSYGISRTALFRWLEEAGVERRSYSDAQRIRVSKMTSAERSAQAKAAHDAVRGRTVPFMEKAKNAYIRELNAFHGHAKFSVYEALMDGWLTDRGIVHVFQKSVGPYNVDFYIIGGVAVEVLGGSWHAVKSRRIKESKRAKYILDLGLNMVFVWSTTNTPMVEACADEIVSIVDFSRSNPTVRGKYWVIRGDGKVVAACRDDMDERALVVPSLCS